MEEMIVDWCCEVPTVVLDDELHIECLEAFVNSIVG